MRGDISLAGFVLTAAEWEELDPLSRAQLVADEWQARDPIARARLLAAFTPREEPWIVAGITGVLAVGSGPIPRDDD